MGDAPGDIEEVLDGRGMANLSQLWTRGIRDGQQEIKMNSLCKANLEIFGLTH